MSREEKKERRGGIRARRESTDCSVYLVVVRMNGLGCLNAEKKKKKTMDTSAIVFNVQ